MRVPLVFFLCNILICSIMNAQDSNIRDSTIYKIRKNSIYLEILGNGAVYSFNYDRTLPLNNMLAMFLRVGGNEYHGADTNKASLNLIGATGILYGAQKHFFETGIGYTHFCGFPDRLIALTGGYRFQGTKGLIIRVTPMYIYNTEKGDTFGNHFWFGLSLGYSF